jgi:four helix bundle protein
MKYEEWERTLPEIIRTDSLWRKAAYRCALYLSELCWHDVSALSHDTRTRPLSGSLYEAVGSIGAHLASAYSRQTDKERVRFYEYSLGSARESRHWYFESRHVIGTDVTDHRMNLITLIIRLIPQGADKPLALAMHEQSPVYRAGQPDTPLAEPVPRDWLENVPMPRDDGKRRDLPPWHSPGVAG